MTEGVPTCGAPTAAGRPCKRRVGEDGARCPQHPENGSGAAESGRKRQETPLASIIALARGDNLKLSAAAGEYERAHPTRAVACGRRAPAPGKPGPAAICSLVALAVLPT